MASGLATREEPAGGAAGSAGLAEAAIAAARWVAASGLAILEEPAGGAVGTAGLAVHPAQWEAAWQSSIPQVTGQVPLPGQAQVRDQPHPAQRI